MMGIHTHRYTHLCLYQARSLQAPSFDSVVLLLPFVPADMYVCICMSSLYVRTRAHSSRVPQLLIRKVWTFSFVSIGMCVCM